MSIRYATIPDLDAIKGLADANKGTLGFVLRPALLEAIAHRWVLVAEQDSQIVGFCNFRHRRDGQTTIYEICVAEAHRGTGIGRALITALCQECTSCIRLKAVVGIPANEFYQRMGFVLESVQSGKKRSLNVWRLDVRPHLLRGGESDPGRDCP